MSEPSNLPDKPPFFEKWSTMYQVVLASLVVVIVLLYWFSRAFS